MRAKSVIKLADSKMQITLNFITNRFEEYNRLMFGGVLPPLPIKLGRARTRLGSLCYSYKRGLFGLGKREIYNLHMRFSTYYDLSQEMWEDIIIHEMIHYYLITTKQQDRTPHGPNFRRMMKDINQKFGRNIRVSVKKV